MQEKDTEKPGERRCTSNKKERREGKRAREDKVREREGEEREGGRGKVGSFWQRLRDIASH